MILKPDRILFFQSYLFNSLMQNSLKGADISFMNDDQYKVNLKELDGPMNDLKTRHNLPGLRQIFNALSSQAIQFVYAKGNTSGIVYIPIMDKEKRNIIGVRINISRFAKKSTTVSTITGDTMEVLNIQYESLYTLLFGALSILNAQKCYTNPGLVKYLRTIYVDLVSQIMNRTFGNPIYGDKFRFVLSYFFHNGEIKAADLAQVTGFDLAKTQVMVSAYPDFFDKPEGITIEDLLDVIREEFPNMKGVDLRSFISASIKFLGEAGFYLLDNQAYYLGVVAVRCRKEGKDIFGGMLLNKRIEQDKAQIMNLIVQSI